MPMQGTPSPEQMKYLLACATRDGLPASAILRLQAILHFVEHHNVADDTCTRFGISRSTLHRWMERFDPEDLSSLVDKSREPLTRRQSSMDSETIELIRRYRMRYPQIGKERIAEMLFSAHSLTVSASSVGRVIDRECLYFADTPLHWKKRLAHHHRSGEAGHADGTAVPVLSPQSPIVSAPKRALTWKKLRRIVAVSSVLVNVAFVSMLIVIALWERSVHTETQVPLDREPLHAAPSQALLP